MNQILRAVPWALAMVLIAVGERFGVVQPEVARTMMVVLPALWVATSGRTCLRRRVRAD